MGPRPQQLFITPPAQCRDRAWAPHIEPGF